MFFVLEEVNWQVAMGLPLTEVGVTRWPNLQPFVAEVVGVDRGNAAESVPSACGVGHNSQL